jgi:hypothetical protein
MGIDGVVQRSVSGQEAKQEPEDGHWIVTGDSSRQTTDRPQTDDT